MKTLKNLVNADALDLEELMLIKGAEVPPLTPGCDTIACKTAACKTYSCNTTTCTSVACESLMDSGIVASRS